MKKLIINLLFTLFSFSTFAANVEIINASSVPGYIMVEIQKISAEAEQYKIEISSKNRTVKKQVEVMLDYYILCDKIVDATKECGIELARKVYDDDCHGGFSVFNSEFSREINLEKMTAALTISLTQLGDSRRCMNHVVIPGIITENIAIDIRPSSITNKKKFYQAVINNNNVVRFYYPKINGVPKSEVKDAAFHLEFKRRELD